MLPLREPEDGEGYLYDGGRRRVATLPNTIDAAQTYSARRDHEILFFGRFRVDFMREFNRRDGRDWK